MTADLHLFPLLTDAEKTNKSKMLRERDDCLSIRDQQSGASPQRTSLAYNTVGPGDCIACATTSLCLSPQSLALHIHVRPERTTGTGANVASPNNPLSRILNSTGSLSAPLQSHDENKHMGSTRSPTLLSEEWRLRLPRQRQDTIYYRTCEFGPLLVDETRPRMLTRCCLLYRNGHEDFPLNRLDSAASSSSRDTPDLPKSKTFEDDDEKVADNACFVEGDSDVELHGSLPPTEDAAERVIVWTTWSKRCFILGCVLLGALLPMY